MVWLEPVLVVVVLLVGVGVFANILWTKRLRHVWPKRGEIQVVNPRGLFTGLAEVFSQNVVVRNRPWVGLFHLPLFFGLLAFLGMSVIHVLWGLGIQVEIPLWYVRLLDVVVLAVLVGVILLAIRRYLVERENMTHPVESGIILLFIAPISYLQP